jgi:uncharacterized membrane protein
MCFKSQLKSRQKKSEMAKRPPTTGINSMAQNQTVRIRPSTLQEDRDVFASLKGITTYAPANTAFTVAEVQIAQDALVAKRDLESQAQAALDSARDDATAAEWAFHNKVLGGKDQVKAQFGDNSNEYQAVGRTKATERQRPGPRSPAPAPAPVGAPA